MEMFAIQHLKVPHWTRRNKLIGEEILLPNKSVLDLGCGAKDLLKYYNPSKYLGVDIAETSDLIVNFDEEFELPGGWDYIVNSGILEYVDNLDRYLEKISKLGNEYVFTWWQGIGHGRMSIDRVKEEFIKKYYKIEYETRWGPQMVVRCTPAN
jgi:cyclopropane fatty-acyl-phospholipid synthase-like methyltransferase